jgi:1-acyl-sn-glycerol-3-phosphate acyltransferase
LLRAIFIILLLFVVAVIAIPVQWLAVRLRLPVMRWIPRRYHQLMLALLGIRVHVRGAPGAERPLLFVSNHVSWLDIPVLSSITPLVFVAKSEIAGWPLFGLFAKLQRSIFVDRSRRIATIEVNREIAMRLAEGDPVVLFGEGTSSDGNRVLPFRSALFGSLHDALEARGSGYIQPVSVAYTHLHGLPMGRQHRAIAAWYGDLDLASHFLRVFRQGAIDVTVSFGPAQAVEPTSDRKALARSTEAAVRRMTAAALTGRLDGAETQAAQAARVRPVPFPVESR